MKRSFSQGKFTNTVKVSPSTRHYGSSSLPVTGNHSLQQQNSVETNSEQTSDVWTLKLDNGAKKIYLKKFDFDEIGECTLTEIDTGDFTAFGCNILIKSWATHPYTVNQQIISLKTVPI